MSVEVVVEIGGEVPYGTMILSRECAGNVKIVVKKSGAGPSENVSDIRLDDATARIVGFALAELAKKESR